MTQSISMNDIKNIKESQEKYETEGGGGGRSRYFMLVPDNIKDGVDITFMDAIKKIEHGELRLDGSVYPSNEKQGFDDAGGKHPIYQSDLYVVGGWDVFANKSYNQNAYVSFWFTKDPNNIRYPSLAGLINACDKDGIDIAEIMGTKWHVEAMVRPGSTWYDLEWTYLGRDDEGVLIDSDANRTMEIINEVTNNGKSTCAKPSLIIRISKNGINTANRQENAFKKLEENKKISIKDNTITVL